MKHINLVFVFLISVLLVFSSCSKPRVSPTQPQAEVNVHPQDWLTKSSGDFHGKVVAADSFKIEECQKCHGKNYDGGLVEVSCIKCHDYYPHLPGWLGTTEKSHNVYLKNLDYETHVCQACHGEQLKGGTSQVSCNKCHEEYPHDPLWLTPGENFHGDFVKEDESNLESCRKCHGSDLTGGSSEVSCFKCHENYPHPEDWAATGENSHGFYLKGQEYNLQMCQSCHGDNFEGGSSEVSCYKCHTNYPHTEAWLGGAENSHGPQLKELDYATDSCENCHGGDLLGGTSEISCTKCHNSYPHTQDWVGTGEGNHGFILREQEYDLAACNLCHGDDFAGGTSEVSCYKCHAEYPHGTEWKGEGEKSHGEFLRNIDNNYDSCRACHGSDLAGGTSKVSCYQCHTTFPHWQGWIGQGQNSHNFYLRSNGYDMESCKNCHGENLDGGSSEVSCTKCHADFPHPQGWELSSGDNSHTTFLIANEFDYTSCKKCHGQDFQGGATGISCNKCHEGFPHLPEWSGTGTEGHGSFLKIKDYDMDSCRGCHGEDLTGGPSGISCTKCHTTFPHPQGWELDSGVNSHTTFLQANNFDYSSCKNCHGEDFTGGSSGISCNKCHDGFPHLDSWVAAGPDGHNTFLKNKDYDMESCKSCHGADLKGGTSGISCSQCHGDFPHPDGWELKSDPNSHTFFLINNGFDYTSCQKCHGQDLLGGTSYISCKQCHTNFPHPQDWIGSGEDSHNFYIKANNFNFTGCTGCHGVNYDEFKRDNSCLTCHTHADGPEACNTCHGNFNADAENFVNFAPPKGLDDEESTLEIAVGAHQKHLENSFSVEVNCQGCHNVPATMDAAGHIDSGDRAEVTITHELAKKVTFGGMRVPDPVYSQSTTSCQNSYCHGNWEIAKSQSQSSMTWIYIDSTMVGNNAAVNWVDPQSAACGSCHDLPPKGHWPYKITECYICHGNVVDTEGQIIDNSKHINGKTNVTFDNEVDMF
ncbi:MAG: hypothetical protein DWQ05_05860 [Calditrichaeota bacterium]|nr:MAG: hypothetical protein DWQ05_05860 [Calditrichota bacterium]